MRWWWTSRISAFALLGVVALPVMGQRHERKRTERDEIQQMEKRWRDAQLSEDTGAMDKLLSDEFLGVTASGQVVTKLQQLDRMRSRRLDLTRLDVSDTKIKISGNLAVVTSLAQIDGVAEGSPLHGAFRYTRVYQRVPGEGWQITNFEATHVNRPGDRPPGGPQAASRVPGGGDPSSRGASPVTPVSLRPQS